MKYIKLFKENSKFDYIDIENIFIDIKSEFSDMDFKIGKELKISPVPSGFVQAAPWFIENPEKWTISNESDNILIYSRVLSQTKYVRLVFEKVISFLEEDSCVDRMKELGYTFTGINIRRDNNWYSRIFISFNKL